MQEPHRAGERDLARAYADLSPRTPRNSARSRCAAKPRQSTTIPASGPSRSPSTPKRISTLRRRRFSASARIAERGSRWPSPGKNRPLWKRTARSGLERGDLRGVQALMAGRALGEALDLVRRRAAARRQAFPRGRRRGPRAAHPIDCADAQARPRSEERFRPRVRREHPAG